MTLSRRSPGKIYMPQGFSFSAACAGIKASERLYLGVVEATSGTTAAAVFTQNRVVASPLASGGAILATSHGRIRAGVVNCGTANQATGKQAYLPSQQICRA